MVGIIQKAIIQYVDSMAEIGGNMTATVEVPFHLIPGGLKSGFTRSKPYSLEHLLKGYDNYPTSDYLQNMQKFSEKIGVVPYYVGRVTRKFVDTVTGYKPPEPK